MSDPSTRQSHPEESAHSEAPDPAVEQRVAELTARVSDLEKELGEARRALETDRLRAGRMRAEYVRRIRELEQLTSTLAGGLAQARDDLFRAEGSRAWRWGHGVTRALSRVARRRNITEGALVAALNRIEEIEIAIGGLPKPLDPLEDRPRPARAQQLAEVLREHEEKLSFCIKIAAPSWKRAERWGDLYFARSLVRALRARGHRGLIQVLDEWDDDAGLSYDVALVIKGRKHHHPRPGQINVLWSISHPAELTVEECDGYDLVCVASERFAGILRERTKTPVVVLEQATDPSVFYPDPSPDYEHELVYVANSRNVLRPIVRDLLPTEHDLAVYGEKWDGLIDSRYVVAEHVPNDELRKVYSSAKLVLCDHWDDMREHGFVSNRVYDALACGATVISDEVAGLKGRFGDAVITYRTPDELRELVRSRLEQGGVSSRTSALPEGSTFEERIERLLDQIGNLTGAGDRYRSAAHSD
jgi:hypothetical protein